MGSRGVNFLHGGGALESVSPWCCDQANCESLLQLSWTYAEILCNRTMRPRAKERRKRGPIQSGHTREGATAPIQKLPDERTPIEATPLPATSADSEPELDLALAPGAVGSARHTFVSTLYSPKGLSNPLPSLRLRSGEKGGWG